MEEKDGKKKESIDDILSDLNGLLNRMPSILDGIKMPELKPVEFENPANMQKADPPPYKPASSPQEQTMRLEAERESEFQKLPEQKPAAHRMLYSPAEKDPEKLTPQNFKPAPEKNKPGAKSTGLPAPIELTPERSADKDGLCAKDPEKSLPALEDGTFVLTPIAEPVKNELLDSPHRLLQIEDLPSANKQVVDSAPLAAAPLFGVAGARDIEDELSVLKDGSASLDNSFAELRPFEAPGENAGAKEDGSVNPEEAHGSALPPPDAEIGSPGSSTEDFQNPPETERSSVQPASKNVGAYEATINFGIPDIDALFKISQGNMPDPGMSPVNALEAESQTGGGGVVGGGETGAEEEIETMTLHENQPADGSEEQPLSVADGSGLEPAAPAISQAEPAPEPFVEPSAQPEAGLVVEQAGAILTSENPSEDDKTVVIAPSALSVEQVPPVPGGIELGSSPDSGEQTIPGAGGLGLEPAPVISQAEPALEPSAQPEAGLVIEQAGAIFTRENPSEDDKTVVIAPPAATGGEEHTVIYEPGPGASKGMPEGDLGALSKRQPPEGVPEERIRNVAFLYPEGEEGFCAGVLSELDSICLKSPSKPMFARRAFVKVFDLDANSNFVLQSVSDAKAAGLICAGNLPQEKLYELENVFSQSGILFRHLTTENFTHSSALDLVTELIMR